MHRVSRHLHGSSQDADRLEGPCIVIDDDEVRFIAPSLLVCAPSDRSHAPQDHKTPTGSPLAVPALAKASTRILAIDPATHSGVAILQLDASGEILSIDVGVLVLKERKIGARCIELQQAVRPLLKPAPDVVVFESYHVHPTKHPHGGKWGVWNQEGVGVNFKLRGALEMLMEQREIPYEETGQSVWKSAVVGKGNADKRGAQAAMEKLMGKHFPEKLYMHSRWSTNRERLGDASDATGLGLHAVKQRMSKISFAPSFEIAAPGVLRKEVGKPLQLPPAPTTSSLPALDPFKCPYGLVTNHVYRCEETCLERSSPTNDNNLKRVREEC